MTACNKPASFAVNGSDESVMSCDDHLANAVAYFVVVQVIWIPSLAEPCDAHQHFEVTPQQDKG